MSARYLEKKVVVGPFQCNCRILVCPKTAEAAVIDPGDEPEKIVRAIEGMEWKSETGESLRPRVKWLFHTHAHLDHIGGTRGLREAAVQGSDTAKIALHRDDLFIYEKLREQGTLFGIDYADPLPPDHFLAHEEEVSVGSLNFSVIHTPGHSPGSLCLRLHEDSELAVPETLYSGDTLFQGSVGRTDLWGADGEQMFRSIRERILTLDADTRVCPGHGLETRIGIEKHGNPFLT
jgi:glyoxylase-like metal-dependent hydrolase (beta-lactamase superfamily II)